MKNRKLASRYAQALLDSLADHGELLSADRFLSSLADGLESLPEFRNAMLDPAVPKDARKRLLAALATRAAVSPKLANFLNVVVDHGRAGALREIAQVFHEAREEAMGIVPAHVQTAMPVDAALQARIRGSLEKKTGRQVTLSFGVDPALIGGAVTRIGSTVYDGSLRTQLVRLRKQMAEG